MALSRAILVFSSLGLASAVPAQAQDPSAAEAVREAVSADYDEHLEELFLHFHRNPELSFLETNTAARMAAELRSAGLEVTEGIGRTGVVGMLRNGDGPLILLRADMDGLPVREASGLSYASQAVQAGLNGQEYPVMHACGHDVHITSLVGTARRLMALRDHWRGTIMFVVQPAEERLSGAKAMIEDGLYERFGTPDYALAFHVASALPTGKLGSTLGISTSTSDAVNLTVSGIGAHGAFPHAGRDPVYIGAQIVTALQSIDSREFAPLEPVVVTVGAFNSGTKHNIISDRADLQITVRANSKASREQALAAIERIAVNIGRAHGLPENMLPFMEVVEGTAEVRNDRALAERLNATLREAFGEDTLIEGKQEGMGSEDFGEFVTNELGVPGYFYAVGGTPPEAFAAAAAGGPAIPSHHSPLFKVAPRESITLGARSMVAAVLDLAAAE
ncbi:amidohydrolase [Altererythrobacter sp. MF3-039]|uniref:amidohydrolase n=1 Tax=Altererythrobacter sp. MF3-039 TaxID=3252901 RepID=UPI00390C5FD8